jgi:hypothetical protein|nr:MAG TPA: hypothetical protein [Caudoviricetes sp.]
MSDRRISVNIKELINSLNRLKVQTGSLACLGCGHEHNCGTGGCAIIREAADKLQAVAEFCERRGQK